MTDTEDGAERVRTGTQVRHGAEKLHAQTFLLQRIFLRVGGAVHLQLCQLDLYVLSGSLTLHEDTCRRDT